MKTTMYLIREGAADKARRGNDPPLGSLGMRQAELTRDFLAVRPIDFCYACPTRRSLDTAAIIAVPHGVKPLPLAQLAGVNAASQAETVQTVVQNLFEQHEGLGFVLVAPPAVPQLYLANVLGLDATQAQQVQFDQCGISVVTREADKTTVKMLNASFHLQADRLMSFSRDN